MEIEPDSDLNELIDALAAAQSCPECASSVHSYVAWVMGVKAVIIECNHCEFLTAVDFFKFKVQQ